MLHMLLESGGRRAPEKRGWTVASVVAHGAIISAAVVLTAHDAPAERASLEQSITPLYVAPKAPPPAASRAYTAAAAIGAPAPVPTALPRFDVPDVPIVEPSMPLTGAAPVGPEWTGPRLPIGGAVPGTAPALAAGEVHTERVVERAVAPSARNGSPEYPHALRRAGVEGAVLVAFVVDTLGHVEPHSVRIVSATHELFADAVRRWLPQTRYAPATVRGAPVRQLVQQQVRFAVQDRR